MKDLFSSENRKGDKCMSKTNVLRNELEKRRQKNDDVYRIIGTELKRSRTKQSHTLSYVADDVCSVSYLCKIEKNQLKPNRYLLRELCKKLNIDAPKISTLFELKELLKKVTELFYREDMEELELIFQKCNCFDNYKSKLIDFIYYLSQRKIYDAIELSTELLKITNLMQESELNLFILFYSILKFYQEEYLEALDHLLLLEIPENSQSQKYICDYYIFCCYFKLNHPFTLLYAEKLIQFCIRNLQIEKLGNIHYILGLYYLINECYPACEKELDSLKSEQYWSLKFLYDYKTNQLKSVNDYVLLRPFAKLISVFVYAPNEYRKVTSQITPKEELDIDFNYNIASFLGIVSDEDKFKEILDVYIPNIARTRKGHDRLYFLQQLSTLCQKFGKYKVFVKSFASIMCEQEAIKR